MSATLQSALLPMLLMGGVLLTSQILTSLQAYVGTLLAERTQDYMNDLIHDKAITLDLQYYESPVYFDQMQRASTDAIDRPLSLLINLNSLLQNSITLVAMGGVLFTFVWWMPLLLLAGTAPALWVALRTTVAFHRWRLTNTMNQRRLHYYHNNLVTERPAAEIRILDWVSISSVPIISSAQSCGTSGFLWRGSRWRRRSALAWLVSSLWLWRWPGWPGAPWQVFSIWAT